MAGASLVGFIGNIGGGEMIVIAIVALVVLGPERLPDLARNAGRALHKLKTMSSDLQGQAGDIMSDPSMQPIKELGELAANPRRKLSEYVLQAEAEQRAAAQRAAAEQIAEANQDPDAGKSGSTDGGSTNGSSTDGSSTIGDDSTNGHDEATADSGSTDSRSTGSRSTESRPTPEDTDSTP